MKFLLGYDIGSSSVKAALLDAETGKPLASAFSPAMEMQILSSTPGFAEQDPEDWWKELIHASRLLKSSFAFQPRDILAIGISYQMHGLVCVDKNLQVLRPSIIWCDSRAVDIGNKAFNDLGESYCMEHLLNSPGNFTASKLKWVKENEPSLFDRIYKVMLPGDFIAMKMTGIPATTVSGLSEGIFWDYRTQSVSEKLMTYYGLDEELLSTLLPTFGEQGQLSSAAASDLGLASGIPVSYRAGDQPNNAWSLNVLEPGEIAATAGTSGVIYGVTDQATHDPQSRVNSFVHVNHEPKRHRYGVLLCVNGTGILNSWVQKNVLTGLSYEAINAEAAKIPPGAEGLQFYPFGNGAERILMNQDPGARLQGLQFNRHGRAHLARAAQEGIAFSLHYGAEIMEQMGICLKSIRAGHANMFLSDLFATTMANLSGCPIELYNTDGALGAARGAGLGVGYYSSPADCFHGMQIIRKIEPQIPQQEKIRKFYDSWKKNIFNFN
ncbi:MAG: xylulokinase [Chitinophagales bacterium]